MKRRRERIEIAPPWRRVAAGALNGVVMLAAVAGGGFVWLKLGRLGPSDPAEAPRPRPWKPTGAWRAGFGSLRVIGTVQLRNVRSPGARVLGIRRADARTGGPVSFRSALVYEVASTLSSAVSQELTRPLQARQSDPLRGCWWTLAGPVAVTLPAFWTKRHQTLADLVAGIIVVTE